MEKTRLSQSIYSNLILDFMNSGVDGSIIRDLIMQRNIQRKLTKPRIYGWKFKRRSLAGFSGRCNRNEVPFIS